MKFDPFIVWWVEEFGHPPLPEQSEVFRVAKLAWAARGELDRTHPVQSHGRPLIATGKRPRKETE